jgi:hypothetical protein
LVIHLITQLSECSNRVAARTHRQLAHVETSTTSSEIGSGTGSLCFRRLATQPLMASLIFANAYLPPLRQSQLHRPARQGGKGHQFFMFGMSVPPQYLIEPLDSARHRREQLVCESPQLTDFLQKQVRKEMAAKASACFVLVAANDPDRIVGYTRCRKPR